MPHVLWASVATSAPMGQQRYEHEIQEAMRRVADTSWRLESRTVSTVRAQVPGDRRVSARINRLAPLAVSRLYGRLTYGRPELVHRFDLRLPAAAGCEVITAHDLPPLRFSDEGTLNRSSLSGARRAAATIVPSEFAANELRELAGVRNVFVIPYGLSLEYRLSEAADDQTLEKLGVRPPFILHAAGASARKNLAGLRDAWRGLSTWSEDLQLVLCGPEDSRRIDAFSGLPRVLMTGRVESALVAQLMRRASAVVVPSVYEGFGLPALEGMAAGVPVVAARRGALPEVCGDAALLVEPDGEDIARGLRQVLEDAALADCLSSRGPQRAASFDWDRAALEHLAVYRSVLS